MGIHFDIASGEPLRDDPTRNDRSPAVDLGALPAVAPALLSVAEADAEARHAEYRPHAAVVAMAVASAWSAVSTR
jgi:hypothetical protein